ncbi:hypothetical protein IC620_04615 [Hazenella sp. IB182357]|uniref:Uncharacterized protein n=1 Tax=Polycladospora coralii TaxID=2771432 RepID=A0A926RTV9_9BACL|nr:hypothetical protein [Polycladospora coralii]MBD1371639.1 hypothetical protein [Polycladospora coralii]
MGGSTSLQKFVLAVITTNAEAVTGGSVVFIVPDEKELQRKTYLLEKILDGMAHELDPDTMIIIKHG